MVKEEHNINKAGIKIQNITAGSLYGHNIGVRDRYESTSGILSKSLFSIFLQNNGLNVYKGESTRDLICLDFGFGSRSFEDEMKHLHNMLSNANDEDSKIRIQEIIDKAKTNKFKYTKRSKEEIRELFYSNDVQIKYTSKSRSGRTKNKVITYKMLYRNSSKAKLGQVMFINKKLYDIAYDWLTMGLGNKMPNDNAKIVELSAYAPLTTSTIIDTLHIPVNDILILEDQNSFFQTIANVVKAEEYDSYTRVLDEERTEKARQRAVEQGKIDILGNPIYKKVFKKVLETKKKCVVSKEVT
ncbi:hypothetical protein LJC58_10435, partial [Lachnospiraceae bacterium OttesenSCG-928-D06]|nr:hypothetical protein [Lachnospiraceae bacterium OttesenSCG-928-D06]